MIPAKDCVFGWHEFTARKLANISDDLSAVDIEVADDRTVRVGFCERGEPFKSGPRKGTRRYLIKTKVNVFVRFDEGENAQKEHEDETGDCSKCFGCGEESAGWSAETGPRKRKCSRCRGTGRAQGDEVES